MSVSNKVISGSLGLILILLVVGLIFAKLYEVTPRYRVYYNQAESYNLLLPLSWDGRYEIIEQAGGEEIVFRYLPTRGQPHWFLGINKISAAEWENLNQSYIFRSTSRALGRRGEVVYYARWSSNNPYQQLEARRYLGLVRDIPSVLDSFTLKPAQ